MATFYTGNSGRSTGAHLDFRIYNPKTGEYEDPSSYTSYLTGADGSAFNYEVTSGYGMREHPVLGGQKMHHGIDYATPSGTALTVNGQHLVTWDDEGGGRMSQYLIQTDDGVRELYLLHGNEDNKVTGGGAITDYDPKKVFSSYTPPETPQQPETPQAETQSTAKERAQKYLTMSKEQMNTEYDKLRKEDPAKAAIEGKAMHKAFFKK